MSQPRARTRPRRKPARAWSAWQSVLSGRGMPLPDLKRWTMRALLLILIVMGGSLIIGFVRMTWTEHKINQASAMQRAENEAQAQRNLQLKGEAEYRESDVYAEQAAREQLGMAREGETVLLPTVVPAPLASATAAPAARSDAAPDAVAQPAAATVPNYQRWWNALFAPAGTQP